RRELPCVPGAPTLQSDMQQCVPSLRNVSEVHSQLMARPARFALYPPLLSINPDHSAAYSNRMRILVLCDACPQSKNSFLLIKLHSERHCKEWRVRPQMNLSSEGSVFPERESAAEITHATA